MQVIDVINNLLLSQASEITQGLEQGGTIFIEHIFQWN